MICKKRFKLAILFTSIILILSSKLPLSAQSPVKIWQEPLVLPTYLVDESDPNPIFDTGQARGSIYPFPLMNKLTNVKEEKTYNAVYLENDYVKLCILPEIGGRIFSAVDKTNNYDFLYHQHVVKPSLIGMLGAWISGGLEWNFPHLHRAAAFMNIDFTLKENSDGSKTIWIAEWSPKYRTRWNLGLTLYPDKSYFETKVTLYNPTPVAHSGMYWANAAVHANESYQVIFPPSAEFVTFHNKDQFTSWPVANGVFYHHDYSGVDVSRWKNHTVPFSFFSMNCKEDFFAGYDHGQEAGIVHVADHHVVPGKKFYAYSNRGDKDGYDQKLTDTDGPYLELMLGGYSDNQPDYSWYQPYEVRTFKQYWYPLRQTPGLKNANTEAALNFEINEENIAEIGFNTTSEYKNTKVVLKAGNRLIFDQIINIGPFNPYSKKVPLPAGVNKNDLELVLSTQDNIKLISYNSVQREKNPMPDPTVLPLAPEDVNTIEELYLTGLNQEQFHNRSLEPDPYYEEALKRDPGDYRANTALGILYCKRRMFSEAEVKLKAAVERITTNYTSPKDGEALYYLGVALRAQGKTEPAYEAFFKATWNHAWHSAAYSALAELECKNENFSKALEFIESSISTNSSNTKALVLKAAILGKLGRFEEAGKMASKVLAIDPLDFGAGNELYLAKSRMGLKNDAIAELNLLDVKMRANVQSFLEMAVNYGNSGFWDEAIEVLSRLVDADQKDITTFPMVYYYLGYFWHQKGDVEKALNYFQLASNMPADYCFPLRSESMDVFRLASKVNPQDARAPFYFGNLVYDAQPDKAIKKWEKSRALDATFATVHRNLGVAYANHENNVSKAIASLEKAVACNPNEPRFFLELDQLYQAGNINPQKRMTLLEKNHPTVVTLDDALAREGSLYAQLGYYDKAIETLNGTIFDLWEAGVSVEAAYVESFLGKGLRKFKAKKYKDALKNYQEALEHGGDRSSQIHFFIGTAYEALGQTKKAKAFYEKSATQKHAWSENRYYQGLAFQKLNRKDEAAEEFDELIAGAKARLKTVSDIKSFTQFREKHSMMTQKAQAYYLSGLGYLGKGSKAKAKAEFNKVVELNMYHVRAKAQLAEL
jgi:tetratricopeptide (TPR) repeat protein